MVQILSLWDKISGYAYGIAFIGAGVGVGYATAKWMPQKFKPVGYIVAIGLGSYGSYSIYQKTKEEEAEPAQPDDRFPIVITDPTKGEEWSWYWPHSVNVQVNNPYSVAKKVHVGLSFIEDRTGLVIDFPVKSLSINKNSTKKLSWWNINSTIQNAGGEIGLYWIISSVWDILPTGDCEIQGTCHRLGTAESNVVFGWFG